MLKQRPTVAVFADRRGQPYRELITGQIVRAFRKNSRRRERRERAEARKAREEAE